MSFTIPELVRLAIALCQQYPRSDDAELAERLRLGGVDALDADDVVIFAPLAFGRTLLDQRGVALRPHYMRINPDTQEQGSFPLSEQPLFQEAYRFARDWEANGLDREGFLAVAMRSSELRAINQALKAGSRLADLEASEPMVFSVHWRPAGAERS